MSVNSANPERFMVVGFADPIELRSVRSVFRQWPPHIAFLDLVGFRHGATFRMQQELDEIKISSIVSTMQRYGENGPYNEPAIGLEANGRMHYVRNRLRGVALKSERGTREFQFAPNFTSQLQRARPEQYQKGTSLLLTELSIVTAVRGSLESNDSTKHVVGKLWLQ